MANARSMPADRPEDGGRTDVLLGRARSGDQEAWKLLFQRYRRMLTAHVESRLRGFMRRRLDAEDVLQDAFMRAWQSIHGFEYRGEGSFRRWLARVVVNACTDSLDRHGSSSLLRTPLERCTEEEAGREAEERRASDERNEALMEALGGLDEEDRDILIQHVTEGLSFECIGQNLGCSRERAREAYNRALGRLQRIMKR